jgi:hypothetical protein
MLFQCLELQSMIAASNKKSKREEVEGSLPQRGWETKRFQKPQSVRFVKRGKPFSNQEPSKVYITM